jgi:hypothetical protein
LQPHRRACWVIPPKVNAAFVAQMEEILDLYTRPCDPKRPLVGMDERPMQLLKETRAPVGARPGRPARYDYEYERNGTAVHFLFAEPLAGWRKVTVRQRKTAVDWAEEMRILLEEDYPEAEQVVLVCDNLNTHKIASFYEAFPPEQARRLAARLEIHYTPKHGSWLNIAECELSVLVSQCLARRLADIDILRRESAAWATERTAAQKTVDWQFNTDDARIKLKHLYPHV